MTQWELAACADGFNKANGGEETLEPPTSEEFEEMKVRNAWVASANGTQH
jgi:hypothetical protein